jgi:hypothetical protein
MYVNSLGNSRKKQFYLAGILLTATGVALWLTYQGLLSVMGSAQMNSSLLL